MRPRSAVAISSTRRSKRSRSSRSDCSRAACQAPKVSASEAAAEAATMSVRAARFMSEAFLPARAALHVAPLAGLAREPQVEPAQAPQQHHLVVAQVLDHRHRGEGEHLAGPLV